MERDDEMIQSLIEKTRDMVKASPQLAPMFFVGNDNELAMVAATFQDEEQKVREAQTVSSIAMKMGAKFIVLIAESWTLPSEWSQDYLNNRDKYKSISAHPKAIEIVLFTLETPHGQEMGMAEIKPGRVMGEVRWQEGTHSSGKFTHLLGPKLVVI